MVSKKVGGFGAGRLAAALLLVLVQVVMPLN
jgi:hypothetical protein